MLPISMILACLAGAVGAGVTGTGRCHGLSAATWKNPPVRPGSCGAVSDIVVSMDVSTLQAAMTRRTRALI
jgi:hypothetical protein